MSRERPEEALLRELAAWGGTFRPGLEQRGTIITGDGELAIEITIRVRRHAGAGKLRDWRAEALAFLRGRPELVRHCGVNIEKRSSWGGRGYVDSCKGRIVAAVIDGGGVYRFVCSRHREKHGLDLSRLLAVIELTPSELREAYGLDEAKRFAWERKQLALGHERGDHRSGTYLQGFAPTAGEEEIRRWWDGGRGGRIPPCPLCQSDAAEARP
jgi:hypothetical protein